MSDDILQGFLSASVKVFHHIWPLQFITHFSVVIPCSNTWTKKNMNNDQIFWFTVENNLYLNNTCSNGGTLWCYLDQKHANLRKWLIWLIISSILKIRNVFFWAPNQHITMISEESCDTEGTAAENIALPSQQYIKKYIQIDKIYFKLLYQYISWY